MNPTVLCPSCKRDVVFDVSDGASHCPACGARFDLASPTGLRKRPRFIHGVIFALWMFVPALVALIVYVAVRQPNHQISFDKMLSNHATLAWTWFALTCISSYACCSWLTGRFTERTWLKVLVGVFLGAGILFCNLVIAFFGACAFFPISF
jgi:hypothetical protein